MSETRKYNHLNFLSVDEQIEIREKIRRLKPRTDEGKRNKEILELYFVKGMGAREIAELNLFSSKKGGTLGVRMIQMIVKEYFPDVLAKRDKPVSKQSLRRKASKNIKELKEDFNPQMCCKCGNFLDVEMHHMIPVIIGGTDDIENLMPLCEKCHYEYSLYLAKNKKEIVKRFIVSNTSIISEIIVESLKNKLKET